MILVGKNRKEPNFEEDIDKIEIVIHPKIKLDKKKEQHIASQLAELSHTHKISDVVSALIKLLYDDPAWYSHEDNYRSLLKELDKSGVTPHAKEFFFDARTEVSEMKQKVNAIYDMTLEMYTMAKFSSKFNVGKYAENSAKAMFILERQISNLCDKLGLDDSQPFKSAQVGNVEEQAEKVLECIITKYDNIVSEVIADAQPRAIAVREEPVHNVVNKPKVVAPKPKKEEPKVVVETKTNEVDSDAIDFGDGALDAFDSIFGSGG